MCGPIRLSSRSLTCKSLLTLSPLHSLFIPLILSLHSFFLPLTLSLSLSFSISFFLPLFYSLSQFSIPAYFSYFFNLPFLSFSRLHVLHFLLFLFPLSFISWHLFWVQFHQHFTCSFYVSRSQKRKKYNQVVNLFYAFVIYEH